MTPEQLASISQQIAFLQQYLENLDPGARIHIEKQLEMLHSFLVTAGVDPSAIPAVTAGEKYLTYRGRLRALVGLGDSLAFLTDHAEGEPTALYQLNVNKLSLTETPLPCGGAALVHDGDTLFLAGTDRRDGSPRAIWAPLPRLKQSQRWILRNIVERLPIHGAAHGFVAGRSIATHAAIHVDSQILLKMDVKDFFPTVTWRRVKGVFRRAGYRESVATLLALICSEAPREIVTHEGKTYFVSLGPRCLPQGAPTSPALTNALCLRLDRRLAALAAKLGWRYSRYADDMTFSLPKSHAGKPRLGALLGVVRRVVEAEGFTVKDEKTRIHRTGGRQSVTGLIVNGGQNPRTPRELRRRLHAAAHRLEQGKALPEGQTLAHLLGHAAFLYMTDPVQGGKLLKKLVAHAKSG